MRTRSNGNVNDGRSRTPYGGPAEPSHVSYPITEARPGKGKPKPKPSETHILTREDLAGHKLVNPMFPGPRTEPKSSPRVIEDKMGPGRPSKT